jgi:hypothetical protein
MARREPYRPTVIRARPAETAVPIRGSARFLSARAERRGDEAPTVQRIGTYGSAGSSQKGLQTVRTFTNGKLGAESAACGPSGQTNHWYSLRYQWAHLSGRLKCADFGRALNLCDA